MTIGYSDIVYGTQILKITNITKTKVPGTIKQKVGGKLVMVGIPGRTTTDWKISMKGMIVEDSVSTTAVRRTIIQAYDDQTKRQFSDGLITASCVILSSFLYLYFGTK